MLKKSAATLLPKPSEPCKCGKTDYKFAGRQLGEKNEMKVKGYYWECKSCGEFVFAKYDPPTSQPKTKRPPRFLKRD